MILSFAYKMTPEHACEMAACADMVKTDKTWQKETLDAFTALDEYYDGYISCAIGEEFARATQGVNSGPPLRILDVGAGRGETSLYLANHGHQVFPVEPSNDFCQVIEYVSKKFGKELTIYNSSAEDLDIEGEQFDVAIFNVSLHHCDDPVKAVKNVYRFLRPGGQLLLINEPMLPFFRTHESVLKTLNSAPEEFGHYGGNEHSYHYSEYILMMKQAGFRNLRSEICARYRTRETLVKAIEADRRPQGLRKWTKILYLNLIYFMERAHLRLLLFVTKKLSLVQLSFSASK